MNKYIVPIGAFLLILMLIFASMEHMKRFESL